MRVLWTAAVMATLASACVAGMGVNLERIVGGDPYACYSKEMGQGDHAAWRITGLEVKSDGTVYVLGNANTYGPPALRALDLQQFIVGRTTGDLYVADGFGSCFRITDWREPTFVRCMQDKTTPLRAISLAIDARNRWLCVDATDDFIYVSDIVNIRLLRLAKTFAAEVRVTIR